MKCLGRTRWSAVQIAAEIVAVLGLALVLLQCGGYPVSKIQHIVIVFQENRTPDNLFHGLPNADIANSGVNSQGQVIPLAPVSLDTPYDLGHSHESFVQMYNGGKMDGADKVAATCGTHCPPNPQFAYVNPSEVAPYFQMAEQYTFGDRMFQTQQGPSFPAHQFIISGTSAPTATSNLFAAENVTGAMAPVTQTFVRSGCMGPRGATVAFIDPSGRESQTGFTCFEHPTLIDLLDAQHLSWRYYTTNYSWQSVIWTGPNAIHHLRFGPDWANVIPSPTQVLTDIANGQLATVSWVIPTGQASDHSAVSDGSGPSWVASVVNAIGNSQYWSNTAILVTWDDWGGWYDHVAPPIYNSYEYGFRVPLIVISPYAKAHYVSHKMHDFGSILRFVEDTFGLGGLGYADARADDLADCFDFRQTPLKFQTISAPLDAQHFLEDKTPPADPDDD